MLLVSYSFAAFCLVLFAVYYLFSGRLQWVVLLVFSGLFYAHGGVRGLLYPLVTTGSSWFLAGQIGRQTKESGRYMKEQGFDRMQKKAYTKQVKKKQRCLLTAGLVLNFGILAAAKYTSLFMTLGISYYTFQAMGYLIDVYRRKYEPERNPARLALFVGFFPQLTAGPISRFDRMREELFREHRFSFSGFRLGAERVLWGYFKKLVIANRIGPAAAAITGSPELYSGFFAFFGMLFHVIELYADFSGCMDIVLGLSQMLGISLPENFERPFFSKSLSEFWRRWHMSLMQWFREYIFFPVSTSHFSQSFAKAVGRIGGRQAGSKAPVWLAGLVVWLVTGIWHGASWRFVTWGLANCSVILLSQELSGVYRGFHERFAFSNRPWYQYFASLRTCLVFGLLQMLIYVSIPE
ncbi:MAG: MBOAT family protein, partial [Lachnospiraceae bacterium]|nr:MBOAT family protein [Lachnospiraceae bacterium]